ncbi:MAG TPA: carboxypeptidase-like regulatory domain-containing protein [Syntrophobacteria bacterium]|nr:carboxypeptidase-like regulatory domain-containing protein [Syntrophobacteria bacterium]
MLKDEFVTKVSFAVLLQDDFSREGFLVDRTRVFLRESGREAQENPSKYYVFVDLSGTDHTLAIENKYYFEKEVNVSIPGLDPRRPIVAVTMKPKSFYPFPFTATLIRGSITDSAGAPIADAALTVVGSTVSNTSEPEGRFVLYFGPLTEDDIVVSGGQRLVKVGASTTLQIRVEHPSYAAKTVTIGTVEEGAAKLLATPITLSP